MIRYTFITILLVLAAFVLQQFLPALTGFHGSRIMLVQLVFLCCAVTVESPTMLLLAFICGFLWDANSVTSPHGGDPQIYAQPVESIRFGFSILLFAAMGALMQGIQPLFKQGKWWFSALLSGIVIFIYLAAEYSMICFIRGGFIFTKATFNQMAYSSLLTMLFSPVIFWILYTVASLCQHSINPDADKRNRARNY